MGSHALLVEIKDKTIISRYYKELVQQSSLFGTYPSEKQMGLCMRHTLEFSQQPWTRSGTNIF